MFLRINKESPLQYDAQFLFFKDYFSNQNLLLIKDKNIANTGHLFFITILPEALNRIYDLQKYQENNINVFVAMTFSDETKEIRESIRKGIIDAKFSDVFIDEIIHNQQIVPEIFRMIRDSKFLIMDITITNYGAYYEAGYAIG